MQQCLIFVRTIFEFIKLKKVLENLNAPCAFIHENTAPNKV